MERQAFIIGVNSKCKDSWEDLYSYYYAALCNYSSKITSDKSASEDIVQGMFIQLWDSKIVFDNLHGLTAYLYKAVYSRSLNFIRDNKYNHKIVGDVKGCESPTEEYYIEMALEEEIISNFYKALEEMSPQQREVILMAMKGDDVALIAKKMDISVNSVKTHKKRAYRFLKDRLGDKFSIIILLLFT